MASKWYVAPSLEALLKQYNERFPKRPKASDGAVGDTSHQAQKSDHNPDWDSGGVVRARDYSFKMGEGSAWAGDRKAGAKDLTRAQVLAVIKDLLETEYSNPVDRIWYIICKVPGDNFTSIWSRTYKNKDGSWQQRRSTLHDKHFHVSLVHSKAAEKDTKSWFTRLKVPGKVEPAPAPKPVAKPAPAPSKTITEENEIMAGTGVYVRNTTDQKVTWPPEGRDYEVKLNADGDVSLVIGENDGVDLLAGLVIADAPRFSSVFWQIVSYKSGTPNVVTNRRLPTSVPSEGYNFEGLPPLEVGVQVGYKGGIPANTADGRSHRLRLVLRLPAYSTTPEDPDTPFVPPPAPIIRDVQVSGWKM